MRKSSLKILSLCVIASGVFGLQSRVDARPGDFCSLGMSKNASEYLACMAIKCKTLNGIKNCMKYCKNGPDQIAVIHPKCYKAAVSAGIIKGSFLVNSKNSKKEE